MNASAEIVDLSARRPRSTYSAVAIALHWLIALLILTNIGLAWYFNTLSGEAVVPPLALHKSIGITVLLLSVVRIAWRLTHPAPPLPPTMKGWERLAATGTHLIFYVLMLGLPISGWLWVSASPLLRAHPITLFGLAPWPSIPFPGMDSDQLHDARHLFETSHTLLGYLAYAAIALHVLAALKHQIIDRDDVLARMIPLLRPKTGAA